MKEEVINRLKAFIEEETRSCKDIPLGFDKVPPKNNVQWGSECDKRRIAG